MHAGRRQRDYSIAFPHRLGIYYVRLVYDAYGEARKVVIIRRHNAGMLRGLAAYKGTAGAHAALRHAGYDIRNLYGVILADGDIVQEKQGLCAAADDIVYTHGNAVDTDGIVLVQQLSDAYLGANAVGTGYQYGLLHAGNVRLEQAAKTADP